MPLYYCRLGMLPNHKYDIINEECTRHIYFQMIDLKTRSNLSIKYF